MDPLKLLAHLASAGTPPDDGESVLRISAGLSESLARTERETLSFVASGGGDLQFVVGSYGRGKTHYLKAVLQRARKQGFVTAYVNCDSGRSPFQSLEETYRAIASSMAPPAGTGGVGSIVEALYVTRDTAERRMLVERVKSNKALVLEFRNLVRAYADAVADYSDEDLADRLRALLSATPTYRVTLGELYQEYRRLRLLKPLGKLAKRNAAAWLRALLSLPHVLGYPGLIVAFDETEIAVRSAGGAAQRTHLAHIRNFIDHMATGAFRGCAVYYAVAEEFMDLAGNELEALSQRIRRELPSQRNPRAVWADLDELTCPRTHELAFFQELSGRIVDIGREGGLPESAGERLTPRLRELAETAVRDIREGAVRGYVKDVAAIVANALDTGR